MGHAGEIVAATSAGTLAIDEDGRRTRETELSPIDVAALAAALADPELRRAPSSDLQGAGTLVTLRATGDVPLDLHFPDGEGPAAAPGPRGRARRRVRRHI